MEFDGFPREGLKFLADLRAHNDRAWFQARKKTYDATLLEPARLFVVAMGENLSEIAPGVGFDPKVNGSILRIARDTRFSKDKRPYNEHLVCRFWLGKSPKAGPGFWFRLHPDFAGVGAGIHGFDDKALKAYRKAVASEKTGAALASVVKTLKRKRYDVMGEHYKRVPKGFDADHPRGDLLRHKGLFAFQEKKVPRETHSARLVAYCRARFEPLLPLAEWLQKV